MFGREQGQGLDLGGEDLEHRPRVLQVDPVVRPDLRPLGLAQVGVGRVGQLPELGSGEIGGDRFERREPAVFPQPTGQVDVVADQSRATPRVDPAAPAAGTARGRDDLTGRGIGVAAAQDRPEQRHVVGRRIIADEDLVTLGELRERPLEGRAVPVDDAAHPCDVGRAA